MSKKTIAALAVALVLVLAGVILFTSAMMALDWNFAALSTTTYVSNTHTVTEPFTDIAITTREADVVLVFDDDARVYCYEPADLTHSVDVKDGMLTIALADSRDWYECIAINANTPHIVVCIPKIRYNTVSVRTSTGNVTMPPEMQAERVDISASTGDIRAEHLTVTDMKLAVSTGAVSLTSIVCKNDIDIHATTGDVSLSDVTCGALSSKASTGKMELHHVAVSGNMKLTRSTGDVMLDACDAAAISITTDTGDVTGTLCAGKEFIATTDTGDVRVPPSTGGGRCEITTDTGDIDISVV